MNGMVEMEVARELGSGEKIVWCGKPRAGLSLSPGDIIFIPFSILWCGFAIFWESSVIATGAPFFFKLWGIPFVLVGLYMVIGRFFADAKAREKTWYAVTNERVLISGGLFSRSLRSLYLKTLGEISFLEKGDRSGTIIFGTTGPFPAWMMSSVNSIPGSGRNAPPAFVNIENARTVYDTIRQSQRQA